MKIGIVTFYKVPNYGAMLQAYVLQEFLERHGCKVVFINCSYICKPKNTFRKILMSRSITGIKIKLQHNADIDAMCGFAARLKETRPYKSYHDLENNPPDCDMYICGSDQMWNPKWCVNEMDTVFLNFGSTQTKRISYAVSFGSVEWPSDAQDKVRTLLGNFDKLSIREQSGVALVKHLSGQNSEWLPDPTLLFDSSFYKKIMIDSINLENDYCFRYALDWNKGTTDKYLSLIKHKLEIEIVYDHYSKKTLSVILKKLEVRKKVPVEMWLSYISASSFVLTDSFHGTVFSILFRRPFITVLLPNGHELEGMNERIISLLKYLGLEERMFEEFNEKLVSDVISRPIDWEAVTERLSQWRNLANKFLHDCVNE